MAAIIYGIEKKKGFVAIIGAIGVGKTTVLRSYLESADKQHLKIIYVFNARLTFDGLLHTIFEELEINTETLDTMEMVNALYEVLIDEYKKGNTLVLVIDEAQNMPVETLESLRMLSNLETTKDKLIQIVLIGQPEFEAALNLHQLRQLKQRIAIRSTILPLTSDESLEYLMNRVMKAGGQTYALFTKQALNEIVKKAQGIPRVMNILCDNALITGFGYQQKPVGAKVVREVISDLEGNTRQRISKWQIAVGIPVIALVFMVFLVIYFGRVPSLNFSWKEISHKIASLVSPEKADTTTINAVSKHQKSKAVEARPAPAPQSSTEQPKTPSTSVSPAAIAQPQTQGLTGTESEATAVKKRKLTKQRDTVQPTSQVGPSRRAARGGVSEKAGRPTEEGRGPTDGNIMNVLEEKNLQAVNPNLVATGSKITIPAPASK